MSERTPYTISFIVTLGTIAGAILGLLGYLPGMGLFGSIRESYIPMAPSTAVSFIVLGLVLLIFNAKSLSGARAYISLIGTLSIALFGFLEVAGYFSGIDLNFEDTLVPFAGHLSEVPIARMSPATGAAFFLSGVVVFLLVLQRMALKRNILIEYFGGVLGILVMLISSVFCLAYLYGAPLLYGHGSTVPMALTTALGFMLLSIAMLTSERNAFPLRVLTGTSTLSYLLRFILPLSILSVILGGVAVLSAGQTPKVNLALILAALTVSIAIVSGYAATLISHYLGSKIDGTDAALRQANEALLESEERYRAIVEDSPVLLCRFLPGGEIVYVNEAYCKCFEKTAEDLAGSSILSLIPEEYRGKVMTNISILTPVSPTQSHEHSVITKDGEIRWQRWTNRALFDSEGQIVAYQSTGEDITERKWAEDEKDKLENQLRHAQKMEAVGRLAGGVAHDFNNMLGVILGHTDMLLLQVDPSDPLHEDLEEIRKAGERSADLTRQLLTFARKQTVAPKVLDLNTTVSGMSSMLHRLIGEDIDLVWKPGEQIWPVKVDPSQIDQILANLCVNARDAITDVGKITIETDIAVFDEDYCSVYAGFSPGEYVLLAVSDDGCGMAPETVAQLFEPFFTTKDSSKGTGLGLATVYGIVQQNKGFVNVYSEPGQGTTFKIYLPRHAGKLDRVCSGNSVDSLSRGHETILLVEDEPAILNMTARMLETLGYLVVTASTPSEAIRLAGEHVGDIHLLMTDVVMPEMNGRDLAKNLLSRCPNLRCLFMSGYTANVIAHHGVLDEGVNFIQKPFPRKGLSIKLRDVLDDDGKERT